MRKKQKQEKIVTEEDFFKAIKYKHKDRIALISLQTLVCGGPPHEIYGQVYLTKQGSEDLKQDNETGKQAKIFMGYLARSQEEHGKKIKSLEEAIQEHPEVFNPKSKDSVFKTYKKVEIMPPYDNRVILMFQNF